MFSARQTRLFAACRRRGACAHPRCVVSRAFLSARRRLLQASRRQENRLDGRHHVDRDGRSIWVFDRCGDSIAPAPRTSRRSRNSTRRASSSRASARACSCEPHGIHVDRDGNVWVTDGEAPTKDRQERQGHQVFKFSPEGKAADDARQSGRRRRTVPTPSTCPSDVVGRAQRRHLRRRRPWRRCRTRAS